MQPQRASQEDVQGRTGKGPARFQSRYDPRALVDVVAEVARVADPDVPARVTQKQWDAARAAAGYTDAPSARQVATRLRLPWVEVLALALDGPDLDKSLGHRFGDDEDPYLDVDDVRTALKTVARRLGQRTLSQADYRAERERMLKAAGRRWRHRGELVLPSVFQAERITGSWDAALALAGLNPRPTPAGSPAGLAIVEALELALESHGALPTKRELERFCAANGLSLAKFRTPWPSYVAELRVRRADWGKWTPPSPPPEEVRPDYTATVALPPDLPTRLKRRWTRDECLAALVALLDELGATRLTQHRYQERAVGRRDLPPLGALQRHGSWSEMVAEARKRR